MEDLKKVKTIAPVNRVFLATVLISLLATTVISFVFGIVAKIISKDQAHFDRLVDSFVNLFENDLFSIVLSQILLFIPIGIYIISHRKRFVSKIRFKMLKPSTMALLFVFTITVTPVMSFINSISLLFSDNVINETISGITSNSSVLVSVLAVALIPAVCEEVAYRGVFYSEYSSISPKKAILLSGLMFGMLHMNLNQFVYAAVMGMVFALIVEATDSILSTMIIHLASNGISVLAMHAVSGTEEAQTEGTISEMFEEMAAQEGITPALKEFYEYLAGIPEKYAQTILLGIMAVGFFVVSVVIFIQIAKTTGRYNYVKELLGRKKETSDAEKSGERILTPSLLLSFIICSVFMVYRQIRGI